MILLVVCLFIIYIFCIERRWGYSKVPFSLKSTTTKFGRKLSIMHRMRIIDKDIANDGLSIIHAVMNRHKIFFWLSEGTALGYIRNGDIISYDDDVDIGVFYENTPIILDKVIPDLKKLGFNVSFATASFICLSYQNVDYDIDLTGEGKTCISVYDSCDKIMPYLREFDEISIGGKKYNIPKRDYIEYLYGIDTWMIPIRNYKPGFTWPMTKKIITTNE